MDYSTRVRDPLKVLEHILTFATVEEKPKVYLLLATHHENVTRDYELAAECFLAGGPELAKLSEGFFKRMTARNIRDYQDPLNEPAHDLTSKKRMRPSGGSEDQPTFGQKKLKTESNSEGLANSN